MKSDGDLRGRWKFGVQICTGIIECSVLFRRPVVCNNQEPRCLYCACPLEDLPPGVSAKTSCVRREVGSGGCWPYLPINAQTVYLSGSTSFLEGAMPGTRPTWALRSANKTQSEAWAGCIIGNQHESQHESSLTCTVKLNCHPDRPPWT